MLIACELCVRSTGCAATGEVERSDKRDDCFAAGGDLARDELSLPRTVFVADILGGRAVVVLVSKY